MKTKSKLDGAFNVRVPKDQLDALKRANVDIAFEVRKLIRSLYDRCP